MKKQILTDEQLLIIGMTTSLMLRKIKAHKINEKIKRDVFSFVLHVIVYGWFILLAGIPFVRNLIADFNYIAWVGIFLMGLFFCEMTIFYLGKHPDIQTDLDIFLGFFCGGMAAVLNMFMAGAEGLAK